MAETIIPMGDRILVKRRPLPKKTPGGLWIPDRAKERPLLADVVAVGPGKTREDGLPPVPLDVRVGDTVVVNRHGSNLVNEEQDLVIVHVDDVFGIVKEE